MFDLLMYALIVFAMSFISDQIIEAPHFEIAVLNCKDHGSLKSLEASSYFGKKAFTAHCTDGTSITEKTK
jgi:hypothetical protein